ncbi:MAG TPA: ArsR family transcriptional regulator [Aggregatilineales bacterium]|nr:ArsR family transcriptional regulator [Aggregatilineales bacterium]
MDDKHEHDMPQDELFEPISAAGLNPVLRAVNDSMLEGMGQLGDYFGYNKVMGKMFGALLLSPTPMSLDDLMNHLEVSKASVSMNMRMLENMGMVREVWVRGDRRKYYEAESDFWKILTNVFGSRELRDVNQALEVLEANIENLRQTAPSMTSDDQKLASFYVERIDQMKDFFRFAKLILTAILERSKNLNVSDVRRIDIG